MRIHTGAPTSLKTSSLLPMLIHVRLLCAVLGGWVGGRWGCGLLCCPAPLSALSVLLQDPCAVSSLHLSLAVGMEG